MTKRSVFFISPILLAALISAGCGQDLRESPSSPAAEATQTAGQDAGGDNVARIVFIDQQQACECTRDRIEGSWSALQQALGESTEVTIERIHRDTQAERADEYRLLRPMITVPAIYLLDEDGAILSLLQGEVTTDQLQAALGGGR